MSDIYVGRNQFGGLTRNERYRRRLLASAAVGAGGVGSVFYTTLEETVGSTDITDLNGVLTPTITGNVGGTIQNAQAKTGSTSFFTSNQGTQITVGKTDDTGLAFGSGDFSMEAWFWRGTAFTGSSLMQYGEGVGEENGFYIWYDGANLSTNWGTIWTAAGQDIAAETILASTWFHVAICRDGDDVYTYLDGVLSHSGNLGASAVMPSGTTNADVTVGSFKNGGLWGNWTTDAYIDNINITNYAKYPGGTTFVPDVDSL